MTVTMDCPCGASLTIEDASEVASRDLLERWYDFHREHRRTIEEYREHLRAVHGRLLAAQ